MTDNEKTPWDRIPSIDMEKEDTQTGFIKRKIDRKYRRADLESLNKVLDEKVSFLPAKLASNTSGKCKGMILDISACGCRIAVPAQLEEGESVMVSFAMHKRSIMSRAIVRWVVAHSHVYFVGLEFQGMSENTKEFLWAISAVAMMDSVEIDKMKEALR